MEPAAAVLAHGGWSDEKKSKRDLLRMGFPLPLRAGICWRCAHSVFCTAACPLMLGQFDSPSDLGPPNLVISGSSQPVDGSLDRDQVLLGLDLGLDVVLAM